MKKALIYLAAFLVLLIGVYLVLSSIPKDKIDKTVEIQAPSSEKSRPEVYGFGYQPELSYSEEREACAKRKVTKQALFGDLHIHTALSADAFPDGTRTYPDDVYRFARGGEISIPTRNKNNQRSIQLSRPLDFAAVTDHAETFGEGYICRTEGAFEGYNSKACKNFRAGGEMAVREFMTINAYVKPQRNEDVCGENSQDCAAADKLVWDQIIYSAQKAYDRSPSCQFTSFVGYEYTRSPNSWHMHRNTIFRNADVPGRAASFVSHPNTHTLLSGLEQDCRLGIENCDVLSIPHNSNISGGNAFNPRETDGFSTQSQAANRALRNAYDRLLEITQHKGASECINGATDILGDVDELCDVEALRQFGKTERAVDLNTVLPKIYNTDSPECLDENFDPAHNLNKDFCLSSNDFARGALLTGMQQEREFGTNPYQAGFIGSSDTHIGAAGDTQETNWTGHIAYETDLEGRLGEADIGRFNRLVSNPGGLAGVYAVENSRDAIFQSMKRRETFATSGPRIKPRFFAGHYDEQLCEQEDWLDQAYANGTPMGSTLAPQIKPFQFIVQAEQDVESNPLAKLQLIKAWVDKQGQKHNDVIDIRQSTGATELCAVVSDPLYDPALPSYYYLRVVETASTRWSAAQCNTISPESRPTACENDQAETIYEMAWSSPIWFVPE